MFWYNVIISITFFISLLLYIVMTVDFKKFLCSERDTERREQTANTSHGV